VLDRLTKWLDEDSERIVKFFTQLVTQVGLVFTDLAKLSPAFVLLWDALKEVGGWLQKIIGQPDGGGLAGVRHLLELISGVVMARFVVSMVAGFIARFVVSMVAGFIAAFAPLTALIAGLAALGIIGAGVYAIYRGFTDEDRLAGTESAGSGAARRGRMGYRGANKGMGAAPTSAQAKATEKESWDFWKAQGLFDAGAGAMVATEQGESGFNPRNIGDSGAAHGSFQWHMDRVNKILAATGIDVRTASHLDQLKAAKWEGEHGDTQARQAWQAVLHATSAADATRAMTYLFERPLDKAGDTYTRQGYANRILREHGGNKTPISNPLAHWDLNFDQKLKIFKDAKPLGSDRHSMNEIHDHRSVVNDVNIHVAGNSPVERTERPLSRPRNADLIRNTASYAA
jgi:Phage tail lysozyme